ncbi:MAG: amidohydrolase family protein [Desulfobacteraceae bacterium]|nr:amidohydrolase family protein [Desulfobacteraceae bacterium]
MMDTILEGMTLIDGLGNCIPEAAVAFDGERIAEVGKKGEIQVPPEAVRYDLTGKFVLPGLVDAHVHLDMHGMADTYHESLVEDKLRTIRAAREMANTLRAGITTVRNAGSVNCIDIAVKQAVAEELLVGPRILASGRIICMLSAGSEYFRGLYREADGVEENRRAAREQLKEGADVLKVMATGAVMNPGGIPGAAQLDTDEMRAVVNEGEKAGKHTAAHAHGARGIKNAVRAGVRTIEHGTLADAEALKMMADNSVYLISTLSSNYWMRNHAGQSLDIPKFMSDKADEIARIRRENLHRAIAAGVCVVMGTDAGTPYNFHGKNATELVQYVSIGLMNEMDAIIAATRNAAHAIGMADEIGTIEAGKYADCLVLNKNPLHDIKCLDSLETISAVFKGGKPVTGKVDISQWSSASPLGPG